MAPADSDLRRIVAAVCAGVVERDLSGPLASGNVSAIDRARGKLMITARGAPLAQAASDLAQCWLNESLEVANVEGDVEVKTSGGRVEIFGAAGHVEARTSGGKVFCGFATRDPGGSLKTSGGGIEVILPRDAGCVIDAKSSGGGVKVENDLVTHHRSKRRSNQVNAELNGGGDTLELRTSGGPIRIHSR